MRRVVYRKEHSEEAFGESFGISIYENRLGVALIQHVDYVTIIIER